MEIREIRKEDNAAIAEIVKSVMTEFNADPCSTVLGEDSVNHLYEYYLAPRSVYFIAEVNGTIAGGAGIRQLDGAGDGVCELQRMFLLPSARGKGIGKKLMELCLRKAGEFGYSQVYLESLSQMHDAIKLYEKTGFTRIDKSLGNTGHGGCNVYMKLEL